MLIFFYNLIIDDLSTRATLSNGTTMALKCEGMNFSFIHITFTSLSFLIIK